MELLLMPVPGLQERNSNVSSEIHEYQRRKEYRANIDSTRIFTNN